jgi:hypothetical protein
VASSALPFSCHSTRRFGALVVPFTGPIFHHLGMIKSILLFECLTLLYLIPQLIYNLDLQYLT